MTGKISLEVAVFSGQNALMAQRAGAHRVELNAPGSYDAGGLTPPVKELTSIASELEIPIRIMIRPVGQPLTAAATEAADAGGQSDFMYSPAEFEQMQDSIRVFKASGVMNPLRGDGFVFGILKSTNPSDGQGQSEASPAPAGGVGGPPINAFNHSLFGSGFFTVGAGGGGSVTDTNSVSSYASGPPLSIDKERCTILVNLARPFPCVFHRAFDPIASTDRVYRGLRDLMDCKFDGLLTSGGIGPHMGHVENLNSMVNHLSGRLQVIVGGGVRAKNAPGAVATLGIYDDNTVWLHSACLTKTEGGDTSYEKVEMVDGVEVRDLLGEIQMTERA